MKVLFISHEASRTGAPLVLLSLLKLIKNECPQIKAHLLLQKGGEIADDFEEYATIIKLRKKKSLWMRAKRKVFRCKRPYQLDLEHLKSAGYDCIFANTLVSLPIATTLKSELHCPLILYVHEAASLLKAAAVSLSNIYQCDKIVAASIISKNAISHDYGIEPDKITIVYPYTNNIPIESLSLIARTTTKTITIGLSGAGSWNKGVDILPHVINECFDKYPDFDCHFVWVGDIPDDVRDNILPCIEQHRLTVTGVVDSPIEYFRYFDIFLLLSREESFSLACAENMLLGTPVVCMDGEVGIIDMVGRDAMVVVPYMSIVGIADALYRLAINHDFYTNIANLAYARITERYSRQNFVQSLINIISHP